MKRTYCGSVGKKKENVFVKGNLINVVNKDSIYLVTDEETIVCVHSSDLRCIGIQHDIPDLNNNDFETYHGSVTMEN